ncbi:hypothetical protein [Methanorbis furvi]|uniref:Uncharacterized protein n=1 Tax=Methanorbis furvi TaxID=3028299 RepID=A0AAE4MEH0_9EURY|nr:hypothetical protein [Methanocorpusculaceae archaeon Ag1]
MNGEQQHRFNLRMDGVSLYKLKIIAGRRRRSAVGEARLAIDRAIRDYEIEHGIIEVPEVLGR